MIDRSSHKLLIALMAIAIIMVIMLAVLVSLDVGKSELSSNVTFIITSFAAIFIITGISIIFSRRSTKSKDNTKNKK